MKNIILSLIIFGIFSPSRNKKNTKPPSVSIEQKEVFHILTIKCNVCHLDKNPNKVFTLENMNGFARKIQRQVFVWKRMPKGKEIALSNQEKEKLKRWLKNELNK